MAKQEITTNGNGKNSEDTIVGTPVWEALKKFEKKYPRAQHDILELAAVIVQNQGSPSPAGNGTAESREKPSEDDDDIHTQIERKNDRKHEIRRSSRNAFDAIAKRVEEYFFECVCDFDLDDMVDPGGKGLLQDALEICHYDYNEWERYFQYKTPTDELCLLYLRTNTGFVLGFLLAARLFGGDPKRFRNLLAKKLDHAFYCERCQKRQLELQRKSPEVVVKEMIAQEHPWP